MNKTKLLLVSICMCLGCINTQAQSIKDILSGVAEKVIGNKATSAETIVGTWKYEGPDTQFKSDNLLAKAGGIAATAKMNTKLTKLYNTLGMQNLSITFNSDSTCVTHLKNKDIEGTYTFDKENKMIVITNKLGHELKANVSVIGNTMSMTFEADKLMNGIKTLTNAASKFSTSIGTISKLLGNYNGMAVGLKMKKQ